MNCKREFLDICLAIPSNTASSSIFGFTDFVSTLALLVVVYTITDACFRFRIAVAEPNLLALTFYLVAILGSLVLLTDIWVAQGWLVPMLMSQAVWRGILGGYFLVVPLAWLYYGYVRPPIFSKNNYKQFARELYKAILKGSDSELPAIANELARSASSLVEFSRPVRRHRHNDETKLNDTRELNVSDYAHDLIFLLGNRKFCRHIVASCPVTAIAFFEHMTLTKSYEIPIGAFASNISAEAILNKDSILYHEGDGYTSGLMGYHKAFSQALYGNFSLIEKLASNGRSPLDIAYEIKRAWDAEQWEAYGGAVLITLTDYVASGSWGRPAYALYRGLEDISHSCMDVYKLAEVEGDYYSSDIFKRLNVAVHSLKAAIDAIEKREPVPQTLLRIRDKNRSIPDLYDHIADAIFEIILNASSLKRPREKCWSVHYNAVWSDLFTMNQGKAWRLVQRKVRRLLYDEICQLDSFPNYKSSKVLGFCLNVMGPKLVSKDFFGYGQYALHKVVLAWTKKNYLKLRQVHPEVAESCLIGSISFDEQGARIVKTYIKGLNREAPKEYLELSPLSE